MSSVIATELTLLLRGYSWPNCSQLSQLYPYLYYLKNNGRQNIENGRQINDQSND